MRQRKEPPKAYDGERTRGLAARRAARPVDRDAGFLEQVRRAEARRALTAIPQQLAEIQNILERLCARVNHLAAQLHDTLGKV